MEWFHKRSRQFFMCNVEGVPVGILPKVNTRDKYVSQCAWHQRRQKYSPSGKDPTPVVRQHATDIEA